MKNKMHIYFLIIVGLLGFVKSFAFVTSKTKSGAQIKWASGNSVQNIYFNPTNSQGANETTLVNIAKASASQWNFINNVSLTIYSSAGKNQDGVNEMYYTNSPDVFNPSNSAVAAITLVSYQETDGNILEADIMINDTDSFNHPIITNINDSRYAGNIYTHEMGHFLGLDHSPSIGSTMFWTLSLGQNKLAGDDVAAMNYVYPNNNPNLKNISGKIVGGKNLYGVFGVSVEAISEKTGKIMSATISNVDGTFSIANLPIDDKYFIYTKPSYLEKLPAKYASAKSNFCDSGGTFRGSFFQACGGSSVGYPQAVALTNSDVDVGNITIRCSLDVPTEYHQKKINAQTNFNLTPSFDQGVGNAFVGFFSTSEIQGGISSDIFNIDLTNLTTTDWNNYSSGNDLFLEIQVINQNFYSPFKANLAVVREGVTFTPPAYTLNDDGWIDINTTYRIEINKFVSASNFFEINITPNTMCTYNSSTPLSPFVPCSYAVIPGVPALIPNILPDYSDFMDNLFFYLVNVHLVKSNGDGTFSEVSSKNYAINDNSSCPDANGTYQLSNYTTGTSSSSSKRIAPVACGTIDTNNDNNPQGPFGMIVGFSLAFVIIAISKRMRFI